MGRREGKDVPIGLAKSYKTKRIFFDGDVNKIFALKDGEKSERFKKDASKNVEDQEGLIASWNEILRLMEKAVGSFIPRENWRELLWGISGGIVYL